MTPGTAVIETPRLRLRELDAGDAAFIVALLNEPGFLRHIGDRQVRSAEDARRYIEEAARASYRRHGFGLYAMELRANGAAIGICGLLRRETLDAPDIGYALLAAHEGRGYAFEAARAVLDDARARFGIDRVLAIVSPGNARSVVLLHKLGLHYVRMLEAPAGDTALYAPD